MKFLLVLFFLSGSLMGRECNPIKLKLLDENMPVEEGKSEAVMILSCHGGYLEVPDSNSLHFITSTQNSICYSDRSCGNLKGFVGNLEVKYSAMVDYYSGTLLTTLTSFISSNINGNSTELPPGVRGAYISFKTDFAKMDSYCTDMSEPICFPKYRRQE